MITSDMKISEILNKYPQTLEVFVRVSPHFKKLENKLLRKTLASRVNLQQAANIAGVNPNELLKELNKSIDKDFNMSDVSNNEKKLENLTDTKPEELMNISEDKIIQLDVRPVLDKGRDPFNDIMSKVKELKNNEVFLLINSFEPIPLYSVLGNKGFDHWTEKVDDIYKVYFFRKKDNSIIKDSNLSEPSPGELITGKVIELDVRELPPPEPMMKILEKINEIDDNTILLVHHHREPFMLYPKLEERGFQATAYKIESNYYKVLISKKQSSDV